MGEIQQIKSVQGQGQDYSIVLNPLRVGWNSATLTTRQTNVYFIEPMYYICLTLTTFKLVQCTFHYGMIVYFH